MPASTAPGASEQQPVVPKRFAAPVEQRNVAQDWSARGYSCQLFVDPPGREWNDFVHRTNELVTVLEGQLRLTVGGAPVVLGPGDEFFIPKHAAHSVKNVHKGTTRWLFGYDG
ncbi:MAG TPA: cupin domain-containing protein [bacterium]